jgi:hypothetical protein
LLIAFTADVAPLGAAISPHSARTVSAIGPEIRAVGAPIRPAPPRTVRPVQRVAGVTVRTPARDADPAATGGATSPHALARADHAFGLDHGRSLRPVEARISSKGRKTGGTKDSHPTNDRKKGRPHRIPQDSLNAGCSIVHRSVLEYPDPLAGAADVYTSAWLGPTESPARGLKEPQVGEPGVAASRNRPGEAMLRPPKRAPQKSRPREQRRRRQDVHARACP